MRAKLSMLPIVGIDHFKISPFISDGVDKEVVERIEKEAEKEMSKYCKGLYSLAEIDALNKPVKCISKHIGIYSVWKRCGPYLVKFSSDRGGICLGLSFPQEYIIRTSPSVWRLYDLDAMLDESGFYNYSIESDLDRNPDGTEDAKISQPVIEAKTPHKKCFTDEIEACNQAIKINPDDAAAYCNLGLAYTKLVGRNKEALASFKKATKIEPDNAAAHFNLSKVYDELGDHKYALESYKEAVKLGYVFQNNLLYLISLLRKVGMDYIEACKEAILIEPNNAFAHTTLGSIYCGQHNYEEAIEAYEEAIRIEPNDAIAHSELGEIYYKLGNNEKAIEVYKEAIRIESDDMTDFFLVDNNFFLGEAYCRLGRYEEAIKAYKEAIRTGGAYIDFIDIYKKLVFVYEKLGRHEEAVEVQKEIDRMNKEYEEHEKVIREKPDGYRKKQDSRKSQGNNSTAAGR